jgi:hypothetical protein
MRLSQNPNIDLSPEINGLMKNRLNSTRMPERECPCPSTKEVLERGERFIEYWALEEGKRDWERLIKKGGETVLPIRRDSRYP